MVDNNQMMSLLKRHKDHVEIDLESFKVLEFGDEGVEVKVVNESGRE